MPRTRLLVEGWEHAGTGRDGLAVQQLTALSRRDDIAVVRRPVADDGAVPTGDETRTLLEIVPEHGDDPLDCLYRSAGSPARRGQAKAPRTITFCAVGRGMAWSGAGAAADALGRLVRGKDSIIVPSRWSRERLIERGVRPDKVNIVPHGIDAARFSPLSPGDRQAMRGRLGFGEDETVLLNRADDPDDAGIDVLLKVFARLRRGGARLRLVLHAEASAGSAGYDAIIRAISLDEPGLLTAETLAAITTIAGPVPTDTLRQLHGMADGYVSPYRSAAFNGPVLEAIAMGIPVLVTRGGATDDFCDDDVAWRISGDLRHDADGIGRVLEPDPDDLSDAIMGVAQGRGFDRLRLAQARMQVLKAFTWERSALALAAVVIGANGHSPDEHAPVRSLVAGLPQPRDDRFAGPRHIDLPAKRRCAQLPREPACGEGLSVVVQGPCTRTADASGTPSIDDALASIRAAFPQAQLIVSTWAGSDIDHLDADDIVVNHDPGSFDHPLHRPNNVNRMMMSTVNGLAAATRPWCIKTRNDVLFKSDRLVRHPMHRAATVLSLVHRIWVSAARLDTSLRPFHPCDMVQFGATDDLRRLWDIAAATPQDLFLPDPHDHLPRMAPEQVVFVGYLRGLGIDAALTNTFDGRPEVVAASVEHMLGAFDVFDNAEAGIRLSPRFRDNVKRPRLYETRQSFDALRLAFSRDRDAACEAVHRSYQATLAGLSAPRPESA